MLFLVHWPGKSAIMCGRHKAKAVRLATALGFDVAVSPALMTAVCEVCVSEVRRVADAAPANFNAKPPKPMECQKCHVWYYDNRVKCPSCGIPTPSPNVTSSVQLETTHEQTKGR